MIGSFSTRRSRRLMVTCRVLVIGRSEVELGSSKPPSSCTVADWAAAPIIKKNNRLVKTSKRAVRLMLTSYSPPSPPPAMTRSPKDSLLHEARHDHIGEQGDTTAVGLLDV